MWTAKSFQSNRQRLMTSLCKWSIRSNSSIWCRTFRPIGLCQLQSARSSVAMSLYQTIHMCWLHPSGHVLYIPYTVPHRQDINLNNMAFSTVTTFWYHIMPSSGSSSTTTLFPTHQQPSNGLYFFLCESFHTCYLPQWLASDVVVLHCLS